MPHAIPTDQKITYRNEYVNCGKERCKKCSAGGKGHGPYSYAYWRDGGRLRKRYIPAKARTAAIVASLSAAPVADVLVTAAVTASRKPTKAAKPDDGMRKVVERGTTKGAARWSTHYDLLECGHRISMSKAEAKTERRSRRCDTCLTKPATVSAPLPEPPNKKPPMATIAPGFAPIEGAIAAHVTQDNGVNWDESAPLGAMLPPAGTPKQIRLGAGMPGTLLEVVESMPPGTELELTTRRRGDATIVKRFTRDDLIEELLNADYGDEGAARFFKAHHYTKRHNAYIGVLEEVDGKLKNGPAWFLVRTPDGVLFPEWGY